MAPGMNRPSETFVPTPTEAMLFRGNWNCSEETTPFGSCLQSAGPSLRRSRCMGTPGMPSPSGSQFRSHPACRFGVLRSTHGSVSPFPCSDPSGIAPFGSHTASQWWGGDLVVKNRGSRNEAKATLPLSPPGLHARLACRPTMPGISRLTWRRIQVCT